jgi:hypothetical protein
MGRKRFFLDLLVHRLECRQCDRRWWPDIPFTDGKHRYVRSFALTVLDLLKFGTIRAVAAYLGVGWDVVKEIHKGRLSLLYRKIPLREVRYIGVDEFSIRKGHAYILKQPFAVGDVQSVVLRTFEQKYERHFDDDLWHFLQWAAGDPRTQNLDFHSPPRSVSSVDAGKRTDESS